MLRYTPHDIQQKIWQLEFIMFIYFASAIACLNSTKALIGVGSTP